MLPEMVANAFLGYQIRLDGHRWRMGAPDPEMRTAMRRPRFAELLVDSSMMCRIAAGNWYKSKS